MSYKENQKNPERKSLIKARREKDNKPIISRTSSNNKYILSGERKNTNGTR